MNCLECYFHILLCDLNEISNYCKQPINSTFIQRRTKFSLTCLSLCLIEIRQQQETHMQWNKLDDTYDKTEINKSRVTFEEDMNIDSVEQHRPLCRVSHFVFLLIVNSLQSKLMKLQNPISIFCSAYILRGWIFFTAYSNNVKVWEIGNTLKKKLRES